MLAQEVTIFFQSNNSLLIIIINHLESLKSSKYHAYKVFYKMYRLH